MRVSNKEFIYMSTTSFMEKVGQKHQIMNWVATEKTDNAKQSFYTSFVKNGDNDKAFDDAVKAFQEKVNPSEDMLVMAKQIGDITKNTMKPNKQDTNEWLSIFTEYTAPMLQLFNSWVDHMNGVDEIR